MLLDEKRFPLVFLRHDGSADAPAIQDQLERLLDRSAAFVLVTDHAPGGDEAETPAERKDKALFFKRVKDRLRRHCRGMIVIEGDRPTAMAGRIAAAAAAKAFGFTILFAADEDQAAAQAASLLGAR